MEITNQAKQTYQDNECSNGWRDDEKRALAAVMFPIIQMQKQYGRDMDERVIMRGWEIKLAGRYPVHDIIRAVDIYTDSRDDFPSPANIIQILDPEPTKVTESQFIAAQKWQERNNNYSEFTAAADTIREYLGPPKPMDSRSGGMMLGAAMKKLTGGSNE